MRDIIRNYSLNLAYQVVTLIIPFVSIPYLSRVLGPSNLGIETFTMSMTTLYVAIVNAGTTVYSMRQVAFFRDNKELLVKEIYNLLAFRLILFLISSILFLFSISKFGYYNIFTVQFIFFVGSTIFEFTWYFIGKENFKLIVSRNLFIKLFGLLLTILLVKEQDDLLKYILINSVTTLIPNLSLTLLFLKEVGTPKKKYFSIENSRKLLNQILPFLFIGITTQIYMNIDKLILEKNKLIYEMGIYNQFIRSYSIFLGPITAIGTILMPKISSYVKNKKDSSYIVHISSNYILLICLPSIFGLLSISKEFVYLFYGEEFIEFLPLFQIGLILMFTGSLSNIVVQQIIFPNALEKIYNFALIIATIFRVVFILISLRSIGVYGALVGYIIGEFLLMSICIYKCKEYVNLTRVILNWNIIKIFIATFTMYLTVDLINERFFAARIVVGVIVYLLLLFILKENLITSINKKLIKKQQNCKVN